MLLIVDNTHRLSLILAYTIDSQRLIFKPLYKYLHKIINSCNN